MDFIDVRKEILNELRAVGGPHVQGRASKMSKKGLLAPEAGSWIESTLKLETSKSQKQDFIPLRSNVHATSLSLNQPHANFVGAMPDRKLNNLATIKNENMLGKREKIRKFMKDKARLMQTNHKQHKIDEMNTVKKVRCNLTKLNEFVQSKMQPLQSTSGITTPALKVKRGHNIKNKTAVHELLEEKSKRHSHHHPDRNITPSRHVGGLFEHSDVSLNISAKRGASSINKLVGQ